MDFATGTFNINMTPGSGRGELTGIQGVLDLAIEIGGAHRYELKFAL